MNFKYFPRWTKLYIIIFSQLQLLNLLSFQRQKRYSIWYSMAWEWLRIIWINYGNRILHLKVYILEFWYQTPTKKVIYQKLEILIRTRQNHSRSKYLNFFFRWATFFWKPIETTKFSYQKCLNGHNCLSITKN